MSSKEKITEDSCRGFERASFIAMGYVKQFDKQLALSLDKHMREALIQYSSFTEWQIKDDELS